MNDFYNNDASSCKQCFLTKNAIMEIYDYDAVASTIKIADITSDSTNREIMRRLKENDPTYITS